MKIWPSFTTNLSVEELEISLKIFLYINFYAYIILSLLTPFSFPYYIEFFVTHTKTNHLTEHQQPLKPATTTTVATERLPSQNHHYTQSTSGPNP